MMEVEVVDENGNGVSSDDAEWEDAQVRCIEDAVDKMQDALYELDFEASVNQEP